MTTIVIIGSEPARLSQGAGLEKPPPAFGHFSSRDDDDDHHHED